MSDTTWTRCSACKGEIEFREIYWVCSVSTCNRKRTGMVFCSVSCWESHGPMMRHRESYAVEQRAPTKEAWERELGDQAAEDSPAPAAKAPAPVAPSAGESPRRQVVASPPLAAARGLEAVSAETQRDVLVVVSKLKKYVKERSGMNTSDSVTSALSALIRQLADEAIAAAEHDGRKTVMDRDFRRRL